MQCTKINELMKRDLDRLLQNMPILVSIVQKINASGGRALLVGGAVRDLVLEIPIKDFDIEVHGLSIDAVHELLSQFGIVDYVGRSFGVFKFFDAALKNIDISLPRADTSGRKPDVVVDPHMSLIDAFRRRDLTMNAMGIDLTTHEFIDPFDGYADISHKVLRAVDPAFFVQDPLRFYRVMQLAGRFSMVPDMQLNKICASMDVSTVSIERIDTEFEKLFLKSAVPSQGIRWIRAIGRLAELYPELEATVDVEQNPVWHPEGDVFEHLMQALDASAQLTYEDDQQKVIIMYAALCHDLGKATTTRLVDGVIKSHGHDSAGARIAPKLLARITVKKSIIDAVVKLVAAHMQPLQFVKGNAKPAAYKRLAHQLAPDVTIAMIALLAYADRRGRNGTSHLPLDEEYPDLEMFIQHAQTAAVLNQPEQPVLLGRDLLEYVAPGPALGRVLKKAYEIQIEEGITDRDELKKRVLKGVE